MNKNECTNMVIYSH